MRLIQRPDLEKGKRTYKKAQEEWMELLLDEVVDHHKKFVKNWKLKPKIRKEIVRKGNTLSGDVIIEDDAAGINWLRVSSGTGLRGPRGIAYDITGPLSFREKYTPKTTPTTHGGAGKSSGKKIVVGRIRKHKGIWPRNFPDRVTDAVLGVFTAARFVNFYRRFLK